LDPKSVETDSIAMTENEQVIALQMRDPRELEIELPALIEALLLVASGPVAIADLAEVAGAQTGDIDVAVGRLMEIDDRGWVVQRHRDQVQLATAPRFASQIRRFLGLDREARLSSAALETVAIIAYRQPVTRGTIEAVRGVDSTGVIATLLSRGLIEPGGGPRPRATYQFVTTPAFLQILGSCRWTSCRRSDRAMAWPWGMCCKRRTTRRSRPAGVELVGASC